MIAIRCLYYLAAGQPAAFVALGSREGVPRDSRTEPRLGVRLPICLSNRGAAPIASAQLRGGPASALQADWSPARRALASVGETWGSDKDFCSFLLAEYPA